MAYSAPEHTVKCPYCNFQFRTSETTTTLYCRKCNKRFPNPYAVPEAASE